MKIGCLGKNGVQGTRLLDRIISVFGCLKPVQGSYFWSRLAIFSFLEPWPGASCSVQVSFHALSVALELAATSFYAKAASTGCTRNAVGTSA